MAGNPLPTKPNELFALGENIADGAAAHGAAIGLLQNTEAPIRADLLDARTKEDAFQAGKTAKLLLTATQSTADSQVKAHLGKARLVLSTFLGNTWSEAWAATGFPNQSTAVPTTILERLSVLPSLQSYLLANPTQENAPLGVTAAAAGTLFTSLSNAVSAVNDGITAQVQRRNLRDAAETKLRRRLVGLIAELDQLLTDPLDPLWYAFGLVPPGEDDTAEQVVNVVATPGGPGTVLLDWPDAARATSYRIEIQIVGVDADFHHVLTVHDSDATLNDLTSGATVRIRVIAVNASNKTSPPSDAVEIVVP
jgi:hypothetical protein